MEAMGGGRSGNVVMVDTSLHRSVVFCLSDVVFRDWIGNAFGLLVGYPIQHSFDITVHKSPQDGRVCTCNQVY